MLEEEIKDLNNLEEVEEDVSPAPKRGRPKKIELPEVIEADIVSVEEITEDTEDVENNVVENSEVKESEIKQETKPEVVTELNNKPNTAEYLFRKGEEAYLVHFSGKSEEKLFSSIDERYIFRPHKGKIKEVLINEDNSISYRFEGLQGCFLEKLVTKTLEKCQKICDLKNSR